MILVTKDDLDNLIVSGDVDVASRCFVEKCNRYRRFYCHMLRLLGTTATSSLSVQIARPRKWILKFSSNHP